MALLNNAMAITAAAAIVKDEKNRTEENMKYLRSYSGFGGIKEVLALNDENFDNNEEIEKLPLGNNLMVLRNAIVIAANDDKELAKQILKSIKQSVLTAFYTPSHVVEAVSDAVKHTLDVFGIKADTMLETSAGIGGFLPVATTGCKKVAIEKDYVTSLILYALNTDTEVLNCGFEQIDKMREDKDSNIPNRFDLVASNIPFGDIEVSDFKFSTIDADHKQATQKLHTYFFVKGMEQLENGGIMAFITSRGVADSRENQFLRDWMVRNGNLLAAMRLPDNLFMDGSGIEVGSDLIIFQRDLNKKWQTTEEQMFTETFNKEIDGKVCEWVNRLLCQRSHAIYTDMKVEKNQYGRMVPNYKWKGTDEQLQNELTDRLCRDMERNFRKSAWLYGHDTLRKMFNEMEARYNAESRKSKREESEAKKRKEQQAKLKPLYETTLSAYNALMSNERMNRQPNAVLRYELNEAYDKMVEQCGTLHANMKILDKSFDEVNLMLSLELKNTDGSITKADVFTKPVAYHVPGEILTPMEAMSVSLNDRGRIDMEYMQSLTKMLTEDIYDELHGEIFLASTDGESYVWQHKSQLLNGNVVEKHKTVTAAYNFNQDRSEFESRCLNDTLKALTDIRPKDVPYDDIDIQLGARWLPLEHFEKFFRKLLEVRPQDTCKVVYLQANDTFVTDIWTWRNERTRQYMTDKDDFEGITKYALQDSVPSFVKTIGEKTFKDTERIRKTQKIVEKVRSEFVKYMHSEAISEEQRKEIVKLYNEKFNCYVKGQFDGSMQTFPGLDFSQFDFNDLYQSQKDCIFMLKNLNGGVGWHEVGAGKTLIMCITAYEMHRLGLANKPLIIGMKANVAQIADTFKKAYPKARLLYPTENDFKKEKRAELFRKIANNDWDCIIMSHDQFNRIPQDENTEMAIINQEIADMEDAIRTMDNNGINDRRMQKRMEKQLENLEAKLQTLQDRLAERKDDMITFHQMGIDHIFVDEYHNFKNLRFATKHGRVAGLGNSTGSDKSWNLLVAIRDMQMRRGTDMCASFFSGTVISNALTELYVLFKYLRPKELRRQHMGCFDAWAGNFTHKSTDYDLSITGEIKTKERFRTYCNVPELAMFLREITDYRTAEMINIDRPKANVIFDSQDPTEEQAEMVKRLCNFASSGNWNDLGFGDDVNKPNHLDTSIMLIATDLARKVSLDPRMISVKQFSDDPNNKANRCARKIAEYYKKYDAHKGTQFVFCDISTYDPSKWNIYSDIKKKLVCEFGIPENEIAFIHQYNTDKQRTALFDKMNKGEVRVLFGSTQKLGTGVNAQERAVAVHHLDIPWRPSDLEQRDGRAVRKGNMVKEWGGNQVDVIIYGTNRTLDAYKFALLNSKAQFINQINAGTVGVRSFDEDTSTETDGMNFAEYVAILSGNEDLLKKARLESKIATMEADYEKHCKDRAAAKLQADEHEATIKRHQASRSQFESDMHDFENVFVSKGIKLFVKGAESQSVDDQAKQLHKWRDEHDHAEGVEVGNLSGLIVKMMTKFNKQGAFDHSEFVVKAPNSNMHYRCSETGALGLSNEDAVKYFNGLIPNIEKMIENSDKNIAYYIEKRDQCAFVAGQEWDGREELDKMLAELNDIKSKLDADLDAKEKAQQENVMQSGKDEIA